MRLPLSHCVTCSCIALQYAVSHKSSVSAQWSLVYSTTVSAIDVTQTVEAPESSNFMSLLFWLQALYRYPTATSGVTGVIIATGATPVAIHCWC
jgi:hypothetical protein